MLFSEYNDSYLTKTFIEQDFNLKQDNKNGFKESSNINDLKRISK